MARIQPVGAQRDAFGILESGEEMELARIPAWVRWILLIPASVFAGTVFKLLWHFLVKMNPIGMPWLLRETIAEVGASAIVVIVGAYVAPRRRVYVAWCIAGALILMSVVALGLTTMVGKTVSEPVVVLGGLAGAIIGVSLVKSRSNRLLP